jgi:hypothetical protein
LERKSTAIFSTPSNTDFWMAGLGASRSKAGVQRRRRGGPSDALVDATSCQCRRSDWLGTGRSAI